MDSTWKSEKTFAIGRVILSLLGITLALSVIVFDTKTQVTNSDNTDMLAYVSNEDRLMLYDPSDRKKTLLLDGVSSFALGRNGQVAFTRVDELDTDLYVFDPSHPDMTPTNISQNPNANHYPLEWSPDGRYLAFVSFEITDEYSRLWIYQGSFRTSSRTQSLYVWDGEQAINIMPEGTPATASGFYSDWSNDGRLAFTIQGEIFLWNGSSTINLSQNPEDWGSVASQWSKTGQLMFGSIGDEDSKLYIWDGESYRNGLPDAASFVVVAPELDIASPIWTDEDGIIAFTLSRDVASEGDNEIIWWDVEAEAIVRRYTVTSDKWRSWLTVGGQMVVSSQLASGIPSVYLDVENTEGEILFSEHVGDVAWSAEGYLAYCGIDGKFSRLLSIWDGNETWLVAEVSYRPVQWKNEHYTFSCNNG